MIQYDHEHSVDFYLFRKGGRIGTLDEKLKYIAKKRFFDKIAQIDYAVTTGPSLVSARFRDVIESVNPKIVEFFDAQIVFNGEEINGFSAINVMNVEACCDMEQSKYEVCNFNPYEPEYRFSHAVLADKIPYDLDIVRCKDIGCIVVSENIRQLCLDRKINIGFTHHIESGW
jgi:hypothetical protein